MPTSFRTNIVAYLLLIYLYEVSAACCDDGYASLICCSRTTEILLIAVIIALCFVFFVQCIIIVCFAHRLSKIQKRLDVVNTTGRGSSYTFHSTFPGRVHERAMEATDDQDLNQNPRARRIPAASGPRVLPTNAGSKTNPVAMFDNPIGNEREIWGLY